MIKHSKTKNYRAPDPLNLKTPYFSGQTGVQPLITVGTILYTIKGMESCNAINNEII